jgi:hypothetical protein
VRIYIYEITILESEFLSEKSLPSNIGHIIRFLGNSYAGCWNVENFCLDKWFNFYNSDC